MGADSSTILHFVGGKYVEGKSDRTKDVFNPATGKVQSQVALASTAEVDAAVAIAKEAFATGKTVRQVAKEHKVLPDDELDRVLDPMDMTTPE